MDFIVNVDNEGCPEDVLGNEYFCLSFLLHELGCQRNVMANDFMRKKIESEWASLRLLFKLCEMYRQGTVLWHKLQFTNTIHVLSVTNCRENYYQKKKKGKTFKVLPSEGVAAE